VQKHPQKLQESQDALTTIVRDLEKLSRPVIQAWPLSKTSKERKDEKEAQQFAEGLAFIRRQDTTFKCSTDGFSGSHRTGIEEAEDNIERLPKSRSPLPTANNLRLIFFECKSHQESEGIISVGY
jgi:hypothetical protein